ncbi:ERCC1 protein, partial [Atractosteus spatula]|nr:ERCC1 protein [Atractosteus spatula]
MLNFYAFCRALDVVSRDLRDLGACSHCYGGALGESCFVKPLFKPSGKGGEGANAAEALNPPVGLASGQTLSYAQFIVQRNAAPPLPTAPQPQREDPAPVGGGGVAKVSVAEQDGKPETCTVETEVLERGECQTKSLPAEEHLKKGALSEQNEPQREESSSTSVLKLPGTGNSIVVSPRQRGNPVLKFVRNVPWEFGDVVPDYVLGQTSCALFLSLRYHNLNPNYIHDRLKQLGQSYTLRVLLVQVDVKDPHHALKDLARICILADCTLILAWSPEEAGRYLETYKSYEKKPADLLKEHVEQDFLSKVTDCLTTVKSVNRTDVLTLLSTFSSLDGIMKASKEDLTVCPGLGPQKVRQNSVHFFHHVTICRQPCQP